MSIAGQFYGKSVIIMGGVGTLLITDWNPDLRLPLIQYYRDRDGERESVARAGQQRILRDHSYYQRMGEFVEIVRKDL